MEEIPIVDLKNINFEDENPKKNSHWNETAKEIRSILGNIGFMQIVNHKIPSQLVSKVYKISKQFFDLPHSVKLKYKKSATLSMETFSGYSEPGEETFTDQTLEHRETLDWLENRGNYPDEEIPQFNSTINEFYKELKVLGKVFLRLLAIGLYLDDIDFFVKLQQHWIDPVQFIGLENIRLAHYPGIAESVTVPQGSIRIGEHTDYVTVTFLFQDQVGGLEAKTSDGNWVPVTPIPDAIVINTGNLLEYWTKGIYKATPHRVLVPESKEDRKESRFSIMHFIGPHPEAFVTPLDVSKNPEEVIRLAKTGKMYSSEGFIANDVVFKKIQQAYSQSYFKNS